MVTNAMDKTAPGVNDKPTSKISIRKIVESITMLVTSRKLMSTIDDSMSRTCSLVDGKILLGTITWMTVLLAPSTTVIMNAVGTMDKVVTRGKGGFCSRLSLK